jgi:hypothetical protein
MRRVERRRQWARRIEEWKSSEITQRAYCKQQAISYGTFKGWRQRLRRELKKPVEPARFVPVRVFGGGDAGTAISRHPGRADSGLSVAGVEIRLASGRAIVLDARLGEVELGRLIRLLEVLPC